jgi:hypothetical protein
MIKNKGKGFIIFFWKKRETCFTKNICKKKCCSKCIAEARCMNVNRMNNRGLAGSTSLRVDKKVHKNR